jgi:hypothetical protein
MPRALLAVVFALAALASGCAGNPSSADGFKGEEKKVADLVEKLQRAGETGEAGTICDDVLAKELRDQIQEAGSTCEQEMEKAIADADDFDLDVEDVTISGTTATARVRGLVGAKQSVRDVGLVREGADWRVQKLG